jgi:hypothetical protein
LHSQVRKLLEQAGSDSELYEIGATVGKKLAD